MVLNLIELEALLSRLDKPLHNFCDGSAGPDPGLDAEVHLYPTLIPPPKFKTNYLEVAVALLLR